jgi:hypothetical protein
MGKGKIKGSRKPNTIIVDLLIPNEKCLESVLERLHVGATGKSNVDKASLPSKKRKSEKINKK